MGNLYVVATPIGNLSDITNRALEVLKSVDFILCEDTRGSLKLLNYFNIKKPLYAYHKFNEKEKYKWYLDEIKKGKSAAIITDAGTPCISDPGSVIVNGAYKEGINVYGIGGISSLTTSLSISGFDIDHFIFYGFFPRENKEKKELIKNIINSPYHLFVFFESPKRIVKSLEYLKDNLQEFNISLFSDLTKYHEKSYIGNIDMVLNELKKFANNEKGEYTFIIEYQKEDGKEVVIDTSIESKLIDLCVKENLTIKDAINKLSLKYENISKKDIYNASLNLKRIVKESGK